MTHRSPPPREAPACDAVVDAIMLRIDRERSALDDAALERHLAHCPRCRQRARELQGVVRALKAWDAEVAQRVRAPDRLQLQVRGAVADIAHRRRREGQRLLLGRLAMAASVVVALGAAAFAALAARAPATGPHLAARAAPTTPALRPRVAVQPPVVVLAPSAPLDLPPSPLAALPPPSAARVPGVVPVDRDAVRDLLARLEMAHRDREAVERAFGTPAVPWADPVDWRHPEGRRYRWTSLEVLAYIQDRHGAGSIDGWIRGLRERELFAGRDGHRYADEGPVPTGRRVSSAVRRDADDGAGVAATGRPPWTLGHGWVLHPLDLARDGFAPRGAGAVGDLADAYAEGRLALREGSDEDLVVTARGLRHPVYVPVGELVAGGSVDRVVARALWIPAVSGEESFRLTCRPISSPHRTAVPLRPVGLVAGPSLRRLLETGADRDAVLGFVMRRALPGVDYSLLDFFDRDDLRAAALANARTMRRAGARGFVVTDARGALEGYEVSLLPREAASRLLGRLSVGYSLEAVFREPRVPAAGEVEPAARTLERLLRHEGEFQVDSKELREEVRSAALHDAATRIRVVTVEERDTGRPLHASALPGDGDR